VPPLCSLLAKQADDPEAAEHAAAALVNLSGEPSVAAMAVAEGLVETAAAQIQSADEAVSEVYSRLKYIDMYTRG